MYKKFFLVDEFFSKQVNMFFWRLVACDTLFFKVLICEYANIIMF